MYRIYVFFEIIFFKLNNIILKGQGEEDNAHFAALILCQLLGLNILTFLILLDKVKIVHFSIDIYIIIVFLILTYFIVYLLFIRKRKYKMIKEKYTNYDKIQKKKMNYYFGLYCIFSFLSFIVGTMI